MTRPRIPHAVITTIFIFLVWLVIGLGVVMFFKALGKINPSLGEALAKALLAGPLFTLLAQTINEALEAADDHDYTGVITYTWASVALIVGAYAIIFSPI